MRRAVALLAVVAALSLAGCSVAVTDGAQPSPTRTLDSSSGLDFESADRVDVRVVDVVDGDTIDVRLPDGSEDTVRLVGVDTPEVHVENDPAEFEGVPDTDAGRACLRTAGEEASAYLQSRLADGNVTLLFDPDTDRRGGYDRLLAYVVVDGSNLNHALVATGHARVYDTAFALREEFDAAEAGARDAGRGLWRCRNPS